MWNKFYLYNFRSKYLNSLHFGRHWRNCFSNSLQNCVTFFCRMNALCALAGTKYYQLLCILNLLLFGTQGGNLKYL